MTKRWTRRAAAAGLAALPLAALWLGACGRSGGGAAGPFPQAPVILVSIDTLRSDHLPAYGYTQVATPAIDALRRDAVLFTRAYSNVPLTFPSHASILSGELPGHHGVRDNSGYRFHAERTPYLPLLLQKAGYQTGAAVSAFVLRGETGLDKGFDRYDAAITPRATEPLGNSQRSGRDTLRAATDWLRTTRGDRPLFLFLHLYEPHTPYDPEEPFKSRYASQPYDGEIATADDILGELVRTLRERGLYDRALLVLLSDHGEGLRDHGEAEHGLLLYREALQVPLLVKLPQNERGGTTVDTPAELVDVMPTILGLLGMKPPPGVDGHPLFAGKPAGERALYAETFYPRLHFGWSELASVIRGDAHYIDGPSPELYELGKDPGERRNVLADERRTYAALRDEAARRKVPLLAPVEEDPETARQLAALGYAAGSVSLGGHSGPLPDPKAQVGAVEQFGQAMHLVATQQLAQAVPILQSLVKTNPRMLDAWETLGSALRRLGFRDEALAAYKRGIEVSGGSGHMALGAALVLLDLGRLDEAEKYARLGLEMSPTEAHDTLAKIALARKDLPAAEKEARAALAARGSRVGPLLTLAAILRQRGQTEEALQTADQAAGELQPGVKCPGLAVARGDLLGRLGRVDEAEQAFRQEIRDFPADPEAYARLAVLAASTGRPQLAVDTLRTLVEGQRSPAAYATAVKTLRVLGDPQGASALLQRARAAFPDNDDLRALAREGAAAR